MPGKPRSKKLCVVTNGIAATCQTCGKIHPSPLHMPERHRGWFCEACCPACQVVAAGGTQAANHRANPAAAPSVSRAGVA